MTSWNDDIRIAIGRFLTVAELAGDPIWRSEIGVEYLAAPHSPPRLLPAGKMAVYGFWGDGVWLKIGRAGARSGARYTTGHYTVVGASTLARSLAADPHMLTVPEFDPQSPGDWMRQHTNRVNILLPASRRPELLSLLEAFLHLRLSPRYEG